MITEITKDCSIDGDHNHHRVVASLLYDAS